MELNVYFWCRCLEPDARWTISCSLCVFVESNTLPMRSCLQTVAKTRVRHFLVVIFMTTNNALRIIWRTSCIVQNYRVSTTPGNLLEFKNPPGNPGNLLEFAGLSGIFCIKWSTMSLYIEQCNIRNVANVVIGWIAQWWALVGAQRHIIH